MSKGGSQSTKAELFPGQADDIAMVRDAITTVAGMPYAPYAGPKVAAFTPMQEAAMTSAARGAEAYGLIAPGSADDLVSAGMVTPDYTQEDGLRGHTGMETFQRSLAALEQLAPNYMETYRSLFPVSESQLVGGDMPLPYYYPQMEYMPEDMRENYFVTEGPLEGEYIGERYTTVPYGTPDPFDYFNDMDYRRYLPRGGFFG